MVMGDLNAKVGVGPSGHSVGPFGLGERNERGDSWVEWCEENGLEHVNSFFRGGRGGVGGLLSTGGGTKSMGS